jgi:peptidoglycan/LPS O-acetylase OafA/YrhL
MRTMTYDEFTALRHFSGLDGLRAVAAVMVVAFHYGGAKWAWVSGWSGVHVFFVLSGFLITTLALREEDRRGKLSLPDFYLRRLFRIVPVYLVVVGLLVIQVRYVMGYRGSPLAEDMKYLLTFTNEYAPNQFFVQSWTLGIEQKFYLVWPLLAFAGGFVALTFARRIAVTLGVIAAGLCVFFLVVPAPTVHYLVILLGCLLAVVMHNPRGYELVRPLTHPVAGVVLAVLFVGAQAGLAPVQRVLDQPTAVLLYGLCVMLLLPAVLGPGPVRWTLSIRPMRFVGERSYSLYLVQGIVGWALLKVVTLNGGHKLFLLATLASLLVADVLYRVVEQPFIRLGRVVVAARSGQSARRQTCSASTGPPQAGGSPSRSSVKPTRS